ncbi:hypothetical protein TNCV_1186441 [Trichonephila clavipes]|nr:hypothetical protein TNCV_1186441 [Trichonephila clavipes]
MRYLKNGQKSMIQLIRIFLYISLNLVLKSRYASSGHLPTMRCTLTDTLARNRCNPPITNSEYLFPMEIRKSKLLSTYCLPSDHNWYGASRPELSLSGIDPRALKSNKFRSGLKSFRMVKGIFLCIPGSSLPKLLIFLLVWVPPGGIS